MAIGAAIQNMLLCAEEEGLGSLLDRQKTSRRPDKLLASTFETQDHGIGGADCIGTPYI